VFEILTHSHTQTHTLSADSSAMTSDNNDDKAGKGERNKGTISEEVADTELAMQNCSL
jgi:hypothetical protein